MRVDAATTVRRAIVRLGLSALVVAAVSGGFARTAYAGTEYGIDVSSFQGNIQWAGVASSGISFAYIRAGDHTVKDGDFQQNWDGAVANGITPGAYLYFHPGDDPSLQAALLIQQLQTVTFGTGSIVPALDVETTDGLSPSQIAANLATAVNYVYSQLGVLPAIYASPSWWDGNVQSSAFTADPLWVANWCGSCTVPGVPAGNWGGFGWQVWQYTDNGRVAGISGAVDGDVGNPGPPLFHGSSSAAIHGPSAAPVNSAVTVAATVTPPVSSGKVSFTVNGAAVSGCTNLAVSGGEATCSLKGLGTGAQRVAADYSTGAGYFGSSAAMTVTMQNTPWTTTVGSPATVTDASQQLVFWQGSNSHLYEAASSPNGWMAPIDLTASQLAGAGLVASAPTAVINGTQQLVFWRGSNDHLWEAWYTPGIGWAGPTDWTNSLGGSTLASAPQVVITPTGQQLVFWGDRSGHLEEAWYTPSIGWAGPVDYTAALGGGGILASAPTVSLTPGGQQLVFWRGIQNHLWESWFTPSVGWSGPVDYTAALGGSGLLASAPAMALTPGGQQLAFWAGTNNHLWEAWFTPGLGWTGPVDYTAQLGNTGVLAGSQPALGLTSGGQQLVFWQGSNSHLWEAWFTPGLGWSGPMDWTTSIGQGQGQLAAAPTLEVTPDQQQELFWPDGNGHIWQALFDLAWSGPYDWTAA